MPDLQAEIFCNAVAAGAHMVLPPQDFFRNGGQDVLAETASAVVHMEIRYRQNDPVAALLLVGAAVGDQITGLGNSFLSGQFFHPLRSTAGMVTS